MPADRKKAPPRRRLDSAVAREVILDSAEKRLVATGPAGIRLQEVAADAGVSHPTVLHHFGSRELLVKAVISRALHAINTRLVEAITKSAGDEAVLEAMLENVATALGGGHARVIMWLALEGHSIESAEARLFEVVDATHALRLSRHAGKKNKPTREDTARTVVLAALALVGGAVIGPTLLENSGIGGGRESAAGFRAWLARLLLGHLDG